MKNFPVYIKPEIGKEESVRHLFSVFAEKLGFTILNIQKSFPDCTVIDNRNNRNKKVYIEFEYEAQNFIIHGHKEQMKPGEEYIVVCWDSKGIDLISNLEVIVLKDIKYIDFKDYVDFENPEIEKPQYRIIGYNTKMAGGLTLSAFENTKIFRTNIMFKDKVLPKGSVIILYQKRMLIGEFTVASYVYLEKPPKTKYEKRIYQLTTYPVTVDPEPLETLKYDDWLKGHIIYTDFKLYDPEVNFSILNRKMSRGQSIILSFDELQIVRGRRKAG
ncbi:hypothetical protein HQ585_19745 [candidate division KSB1 bacterium]|nr:hypothetical protein [candidate division KSB1 bacterium]